MSWFILEALRLIDIQIQENISRFARDEKVPLTTGDGSQIVVPDTSLMINDRMKTLVRIEGSLAELTPMGWKSQDLHLEHFCQYAVSSGAYRHWHPNPDKAWAEQLLETCRQEHIDAEIISIADNTRSWSDPEEPNAKF